MVQDTKIDLARKIIQGMGKRLEDRLERPSEKGVRNDPLGPAPAGMLGKARQSDWTPREITKELKARGYSLVEVSLASGCDPNAAARALDHPWPMMEQAIAAKLNTHPQVIWPSRYNISNRPLWGSRHA